MSERVIRALYFSPTGSTRKIITQLSHTLAGQLHCPDAAVDLTPPENRRGHIICSAGDILVLGLPVYGDGLPRVLPDFLGHILGQGCLAVAVAVYGNRSYGHALTDMGLLLQEAGCRVFAGAAFIGQHSYTQRVGAARPDQQDMAIVNDFACRLARKAENDNFAAVTLGPDTKARPVEAISPAPLVEEYYRCHPLTNEDCNDCGFCADICPVGAIDKDDPRLINGPCLRCCACVNRCPRQAKYFRQPHFTAITRFLEEKCLDRREAELFL